MKYYLLETVASIEDDRRQKGKEEQLWIKEQLQTERKREREMGDNMKINHATVVMSGHVNCL